MSIVISTINQSEIGITKQLSYLVMTNIAMENPLEIEVNSWENHLFRLGPSIPWLC